MNVLSILLYSVTSLHGHLCSIRLGWSTFFQDPPHSTSDWLIMLVWEKESCVPLISRVCLYLLTVPQRAGTGSLCLLSTTHTLLNADSGTGRALWHTHTHTRTHTHTHTHTHTGYSLHTEAFTGVIIMLCCPWHQYIVGMFIQYIPGVCVSVPVWQGCVQVCCLQGNNLLHCCWQDQAWRERQRSPGVTNRLDSPGSTLNTAGVPCCYSDGGGA